MPSTQDLNLLAAIPYQLGFRPTDSAVMVSVRANRVCGLMIRVDLCSIIEGREALVNELVEHLGRDGATGIVVAIYSDDDVVATGRGEGICALTAQALMELERGCSQTGLLKMWLVGEQEFAGLELSGSWLMVMDRYDIACLSQAPIAAELVLAGRAIAEDRDGLGQLPQLTEDVELLVGLSENLTASRATDPQPGVLALWREVLERGPMTWPSPDQLAAESDMWRTLAAGLHDIDTRDVMIVGAALPSWLAAGPTGSAEHSELTAHAMKGMLDPAAPIEPDSDLVQRAVVALEIIAAFSAPHLRGPALTLLALLAWWSGHGALAGVRLDQVEETDGDYRLARLVRSAVLSGVPPAWIAARSAPPRAGNS